MFPEACVDGAADGFDDIVECIRLTVDFWRYLVLKLVYKLSKLPVSLLYSHPKRKM